MARSGRRILAACLLTGALTLGGCSAQPGDTNGSGQDETGPQAVPTPQHDPAGPDGQELPWLQADDEALLRDQLERAVENSRDELGMELGIDVVDRGTGEKIAVNDTTPVRTASMSKVAIAMTYLRQVRDSGLQVTDEARSQLEKSLKESDNPAADALYTTLTPDRSEALQRLHETYALLGTTCTVAPIESWGATWTCADDQLKVVQALQEPPEWLHPDDAELIRGLLTPEPGSADESQEFGVGVLNDSQNPTDGAEAHDLFVKNGWLAEDTEQWSVSTMGHAAVNGYDYDIVITSFGAQESEHGFNLLSDLVRLIDRVTSAQ